MLSRVAKYGTNNERYRGLWLVPLTVSYGKLRPLTPPAGPDEPRAWTDARRRPRDRVT